MSYETQIDDAARRTAITLMRLNEAIDLADAEDYGTIPVSPDTHSPRNNRESQVRYYYRKWFRSQGRMT